MKWINIFRITALGSAVLFLSLSLCLDVAFSQESSVVPSRTIVTQLPLEAASRTVLLYHQEGRGYCVDELTIRCQRKVVRVGQDAIFRVNLRRKCGGRYLEARLPQRAELIVSDPKVRRSAVRYEVVPKERSFRFTHQFKRATVYQVKLILHYDALEHHTITMPLQTLPIEAGNDSK